MSTFWSVIINLLYTAAFVACLWWANWTYQQLRIGQRFNLPASIRLLVILVVGGLVYSPVSRILGSIFDIFRKYSSAWVNAASVVEALAILAIVLWLYTRTMLNK